MTCGTVSLFSYDNFCNAAFGIVFGFVIDLVAVDKDDEVGVLLNCA